MSTKPRFLLEVERRLARAGGDSERLELYEEVFSSLIENIATFGPVLARVKAGYDGYIR